MKRYSTLMTIGLALLAGHAAATETVSTGFALSDGFTTGGTTPVTVSSGDFDATFSGGQQQQSFDGPSYNAGPDAYLFISGPSFTGSFGNSTPGTGDKGLIDFNLGADSVTLFAADRAIGTPTLRVFGRDDATVLFEAPITQTSNRASDGATPTVLTAAALGGLIGSVEIDNAGPAGNPPYVTAIDTFSATTEVVFAESPGVDLSGGDPAAPTPVDFGLGSNVVTGSVSAGSNDTRDYLTFTIDPGFQLNAILQLEYDDPAVNDGVDDLFDGNRGFYALFEGVDGSLPASGNNLGGDHLDPIGFGADLLPAIADGGISSGSGFDLPLQAGTYTFLVQQTGPQVSNYAFDFVVAPIPEPTTAVMALVAVAACTLKRRP